MNAIYTDHPEAIALAKRAYPEYNGRTFRIEVAPHPINVKSYWDGGSRSYFKFIRLDGSADTLDVPTQSAFDAQIKNADAVPLVPGLACVEHTIFCGKDTGIRIYLHPDNAPRYLPAPVELTDDERIVLKYTAHLKNTYGGRTHIRFTEANHATNITAARWEAAQVTLVTKKLLDARGSITHEGRNANNNVRG
jgi:hypothetical protein